jgi:hypothetical protein
MKTLIIVVLVSVLSFGSGIASVLYCPWVQNVVSCPAQKQGMEKCTCSKGECPCCKACPGSPLNKKNK